MVFLPIINSLPFLVNPIPLSLFAVLKTLLSSSQNAVSRSSRTGPPSAETQVTTSGEDLLRPSDKTDGMVPVYFVHIHDVLVSVFGNAKNFRHWRLPGGFCWMKGPSG